MRRREGGAGCGTRERGKRKPRPRAALGKPPRGTMDRGLGPTAENAKAERCRVARREDAGARVMCARDPAFRARPVQVRAGLAKSRPCAFSARHSPHGEKEKRRANPQARPKLGPAERWL